MSKRARITICDKDFDGLLGTLTLEKKAFGYDQIRSRRNLTRLYWDHTEAENSMEQIQEAVEKYSKAGYTSIELYFVDTVPPKEQMDKLMVLNKKPKVNIERIYLFDHHESGFNMLQDYQPEQYSGMPMISAYVDKDRLSAARMVWDAYADPKEKIPHVLNLSDEMDASEFFDDEKYTREAKAMAAAGIDKTDIKDEPLKALRRISQEVWGSTMSQFIRRGKDIYESDRIRARQKFNNASFVKLSILPDEEPVTVPIISAEIDYFGRAFSQNAVLFAEHFNDKGFIMVWYPNGNSAYVSLRSNKKLNCAESVEHLKETFNAKGGGKAQMGALQFETLVDFSHNVLQHSYKPDDDEEKKKVASAAKKVTAPVVTKPA